MSTIIKSLYSPKTRVQLTIKSELASENRTKQSFKDEVNINKIVQRIKRIPGGSSMLSGGVAPGAQYVDLVDRPQYQDALSTVAKANQAFAALPAALRAECDNDPAVFVQKAQDRAWAVKNGLIKETPQPAVPVNAGVQPASPPSGQGSATTGQGPAPEIGVVQSTSSTAI